MYGYAGTILRVDLSLATIRKEPLPELLAVNFIGGRGFVAKMLYDEIRPWTRCLRCNGLLRPVTKEAIHDRLEPKTRQYFFAFRMCDTCEQIYWRGSHFGRLRSFVDMIRATQSLPGAGSS